MADLSVQAASQPCSLRYLFAPCCWCHQAAWGRKRGKIEAKVREIGKLRGDKRIAFIRSVGEAAQVLTDEQRQTLVGMLPPDPSATNVGNQN